MKGKERLDRSCLRGLRCLNQFPSSNFASLKNLLSHILVRRQDEFLRSKVKREIKDLPT